MTYEFADGRTLTSLQRGISDRQSSEFGVASKVYRRNVCDGEKESKNRNCGISLAGTASGVYKWAFDVAVMIADVVKSDACGREA